MCRGEGRVAKNTKLNVNSAGGRLRLPPALGRQRRGRRGRRHAGDLYIVISVKEHELFERQGDDLFCEIPIKFTLATLGGSIEVPTLTGKASLKIPAARRAAPRSACVSAGCRPCAAAATATS